MDASPSQLSDWLIGHGRHFISTAEVAEIYDINPASVPAGLERARGAGKLISRLPWSTTRRSLRPSSDDVQDFAAPFVVNGRDVARPPQKYPFPHFGRYFLPPTGTGRNGPSVSFPPGGVGYPRRRTSAPRQRYVAQEAHGAVVRWRRYQMTMPARCHMSTTARTTAGMMSARDRCFRRRRVATSPTAIFAGRPMTSITGFTSRPVPPSTEGSRNALPRGERQEARVLRPGRRARRPQPDPWGSWTGFDRPGR